MRHTRVLIATLVLTTLTCGTPARAQTVPPIVGVWKLNRRQSPHAASAAQVPLDIRQYTLRPDGISSDCCSSNDHGVSLSAVHRQKRRQGLPQVLRQSAGRYDQAETDDAHILRNHR